MANFGVMSTNDDAASCKRYAVSKNYWQDEYLQYFVKLSERRTPEINRGYYIRYKCVRNIVNQFLSITNRKCQIINMGAGFDTMYWNLFNENLNPIHGFYEIDFPQVVQRKCYCINSKQQLQKCLTGDIKIDKEVIESEFYNLFSADITKIDELNSILIEKGIDKNIPTLFLTECVMVYISIENGKNLLKYISDNFPTVLYSEYDPINLNDRFGEVMKQNLRNRQCNLLGLHENLKSKITFLKYFFKNVNAKSMVDVYNEIPIAEKQRMEKLEFFDEIELLTDLLTHYCISSSFNDSLAIGFKS